jgi:hypothetical protein
MMSQRMQTLTRQLGLHLEVLGEEIQYWVEQRAPVRFALTANALPLADRWRSGQ